MAELSWHAKWICDKERFWLKERRKRVRAYEGVPLLWGTTQFAWIHEGSERVCEEPHRLHGSMKGRQECVGPRAGKDRMCISYNAMMSIYSPLLSPTPVSLYLGMPPHPSAHGAQSVSIFPSISVCPPPASPCQTEWRWWSETDFVITMATKCMSEFSHSQSAGDPLITLKYRLQPDWLYVYIERLR